MRVIIVDDEPLARAVLREHLGLHPDVEIVGECANGFEAVKAIAAAVKDSTVCSLARANDRDISRAAEALAPAQRARIHTFIATSELHMEKKLRMTREQVLDQATLAVRFARNLCGDIEFSPEDGYRSDIDFLARVCEAVINEGAGAPIEILVDRGGAQENVTVTPQEGTGDAAGVWQIGITLTVSYTFPFDVQVQLNNVGGPSAGMMFALGIIDTLTPGELNGGERIAGTGTIDAGGAVGPIGGIRQKLYGARDAGATVFLAPEENCDEVVGHVPDGLQVFRTGTLEESLDILEVVADGGDTSKLPVCTANR